MRIVLKHIKQLPNGKYQYRRVWPEDVRAALPELGRELKRTFEASLGQDGAILKAVALDRQFDGTVRAIRDNRGERPAWEVMQRVRQWYEENRRELAAVILEDVVYAPDAGEVLIQETAADLEIDRILDKAIARSGADRFGHPVELTLEDRLKIEILQTGELTAPPLRIGGAFQLYTEKNKAGRVDRSAKAAVDQFIEYCGDIELERIRNAQIMDWLDHLIEARQQSYETVKKRLGALKAIVNFARRRGAFEGANPFVGHKVPEHARPTLDRLPFHKVHLEAIDRYLEAGSVQEETRWVVALLKHTGCRPSEIGGLRGEDLSLETPIPYMLVRWSEGRRLKTTDSERRVPLIGKALEAARMAHKRHPKGWLFPSLAPTSGKLNDNQAISARINGVIRRAGVAASPRLVCYSFRHTMAAALDQTPGLAHAVRERVLGRQRAQYGAKELPLEETFEALSRAMPLLGKVDDVLYAPGMLEITRGD